MSYERRAARVTIDNPDADGALSTWGFGLDHPAAEPRIDERAFTPDLEGSYGWQMGGDLEYLESIGAIAPVGQADLGHMTLGNWTVGSGLWKETPTAGLLRYRWLHFYDGRTELLSSGDYGSITGPSMGPGLQVWAWRIPPAPDETDPALMDIVLHGNGTLPVYRLRFPMWASTGGLMTGDDRRHRYPTLYGRRQGDSSWSVVDDMRMSGGRQAAMELEGGSALQIIRIEFDDDWLIVRLNDADRPWTFRGGWSAGDEQVPLRLVSGPVGVEVCGHTAMVNVQDLSYSDATMRTHLDIYTAAQVETTPQYRTIDATPGSTGVSVAASVDGQRSHPVVTFDCAGGQRPVLYNVQEYREPTFSAANSSPWTSEDDATGGVLEMRGHCNDRWRDGDVTVRLQAAPGESLHDVSYNEKVTAEVIGSTATTLMFTGYVSENPEISRDDGTGEEMLRLTALDGIRARLAEKRMYAHPSYEGWPVDEAFSYILNRCGVPNELISVDADVSVAEMGPHYYLPEASARGARMLQFRATEQPETALDTIAEVRGLQWGFDQTGTYFLQPIEEHSSGESDHTLDGAAEGIADAPIAPFRATRSLQEFANAMLVMVGRGWDARGATRWDHDSITDATDEYYVGEDFWRVETYPDGDNAQLIIKDLWRQRTELSRLIYWETCDHEDWMPGDHVKLTNMGFDIPDNSIFRITDKSWSVTGGRDNGELEITFEGVIVELGSGA